MSKTSIPPFEFIPYQHEPLATPNSIRLLSVIPEENNKSRATICGQPILACSLENVNLDHAPVYSALSCTQENPRVRPDERYGAAQKWPISVNGRLMYVTKNVYEALQHAQRSAVDQNELDLKRYPYQKTLLIQAAEEGQVDEMKRLISHGASLHIQDCFGETALHYAAENGHLEAVKLLLASGADKSTLDSSKRTPLSCCLQRKRNRWTQVQSALTYHRPTPDGPPTTATPAQLPQIWIDAVCVDPANPAERNARAALVSRVYAHALKVTVWLGAADAETPRAAEILARVADHDAWLGLEEPEREVVRGIVREHTWFHRGGWAVQELAFAPVVEMYSGDYAFDWDVLSGVLPVQATERTGELEPRLLPPPVPKRDGSAWTNRQFR